MVEHSKLKKIALVTGASGGIGRAIVQKLVQSGICVIGTATSEQGQDEIMEIIASFHKKQGKDLAGNAVILDVTNPENINTVIASITAKYGDINILVNNAGITRDGLFLRMKEEDWDAVLDTNLKSVFLMSKAVIRGMTKQRYGRIVNISSVVGFTGNVGQVNYASAKAGMVAFSKSLAQEIGSRNITVNCIAPGFIETAMTAELPEEIKNNFIKNIPLGKFGHPCDVACAVNFLVSDDANYITGTTLHVNGGLYM